MSDVYRKGLSPQTRSISSSRNRLFAVGSADTAPQVIGVVSSFSPSDARNNEVVRGIGFGDQIAELVPGMSEPISISITRTALYQMNIFQALGYSGGIDGLVRALKHHRWPFDLRQEVVISQADGALAGTNVGNAASSPENFSDTVQAIATLYAGCWLTSYSSTFSADTAIVAEEVQMQATDIFAWNNGNLGTSIPAADTGKNTTGQGRSTIFGSTAR